MALLSTLDSPKMVPSCLITLYFNPPRSPFISNSNSFVRKPLYFGVLLLLGVCSFADAVLLFNPHFAESYVQLMIYGCEWIRRATSLKGRATKSQIAMLSPQLYILNNLPFVWCWMIGYLHRRHFVDWRRKDFPPTFFEVDVEWAISTPLLSCCSPLIVRVHSIQFYYR
jgi:hypothetical protein